ncbi:MAG: hypothetical protein LIO43_03565 [Clostridiales bacterium]|nr:hypothetical protein [Clostridiales bacterium]
MVKNNNMNFIYEQTISPNADYVNDEKDIVNFTVEIYQDKDCIISVYAKSNSAFFEPIQYEVECGCQIAKSNVNIDWATLSGNPNPSENNQISIAYVSFSENGKVFDKRKINFVSKVVDIVEDSLSGR